MEILKGKDVVDYIIKNNLLDVDVFITSELENFDGFVPIRITTGEDGDSIMLTCELYQPFSVF